MGRGPGGPPGGRPGGGGAGVSNIRNPRQSLDAQRTQLDFVQSLNRAALQREPHNPGVEGAIESFELAFRMQKDMPQVLDIANERKEGLFGLAGFALLLTGMFLTRS